MPDFKLPDLGEGVTEAEIDAWLVDEGETVGEDDPLVLVTTDKASAEIPSPFEGVVVKIHVREGDVVPVGTILVTIEGAEPATMEARPGAAAAEPWASSPRAPRAMPPVRKLAEELGIDLALVRGSGSGGQILRKDVEAHAATAAPEGAPAPGPARPAAVRGRREPLRGVRRTIAERMLRSHLAIPSVTHVEECDVTELEATRRALNERAPEGPKLTYLPFVVKAVVPALKRVPALNASLDEEANEIVYREEYNIGIAVDTGAGLIVPVVAHADEKDLLEIAVEIEELARAAREGSIGLEQLRGGTFTVTSPGPHGGLLATPLINHPQTGILGVNKAIDRPVVRDGQVVIRRIMNLSVTFDHRVLDGVAGAEFALEVVNLLQDPGLLVPGL